MWRWAKRWTDWVRNELVPLTRLRRGGYSVHVRYETGGRTHQDLPVPWTADIVTVEVQLRLPPPARRKADFVLRFPDAQPVTAEAVRPESADRHRVLFRFPPPRFTVAGQLFWKNYLVAAVGVPVLSAETFLAGLAVASPTVAVRLAGQVVMARQFVPDGCKGLVASAVLRATHRLGPVADLGLAVVFRHERTGQAFEVPVPLTSEQRAATEALVIAVCPRVPRRPGVWRVAWRVGNRELVAQHIEAIPACQFEDAVRVADARFAVADKLGAVRVTRQPPALAAVDRVGPCFVVVGDHPGAVGVCELTVCAVSPGDPHPTQLVDQAVLVTDAPTVFAPGLLSVGELSRIGAFELRLNGRVLGAASLSPVPPATFTAEGGFKPPPDFTWTAAAEEELQERLSRLGGS